MADIYLNLIKFFDDPVPSPESDRLALEEVSKTTSVGQRAIKAPSKNGITDPAFFYEKMRQRELGISRNRSSHEWGKITFPNGATYEGELVNGEIHGRGIFIEPNGTKYEGDFVEGNRQGWGVIIFPDGLAYTGEFLNNEMHGRGSIRFSDGSTYSGAFRNNTMHGQGIVIEPDGTKYEGDFVEGVKQGFGIITFPDGTNYKGEVANNLMHGQGSIKFSNGNTYEGEFANNTMHGKGFLFEPNKSAYHGDFVDGIPHGLGTMIFPEGSTYKGEFERGKKHGWGIFTAANGASFRAEFVQERISNIDMDHEIGSKLFLESLLGISSSGLFHEYGLMILSRFLSLHGNPSEGSCLASAHQMLLLNDQNPTLASEHIFSKLLNGESQLLYYGSHQHAIGLHLIPKIKEGYVDFEIYNSGEGLEIYHEAHPANLKKYQTRKIVRVPLESLNQEMIAALLSNSGNQTTQQAYERILNIPGASLIKTESEKATWQTAQKGSNCSMEWIFAFLKHQLSPEEYKTMRLTLFTYCLKAYMLRSDPQNDVIVKELMRKIDKRMRQ